MTTEWNDCTDPEELFRLKREGWEVEYCTIYGGWAKWDAATWNRGIVYRCRQPQPKTITLRKALLGSSGAYRTEDMTEEYSTFEEFFVCWLGEPYTVEIPK